MLSLRGCVNTASLISLDTSASSSNLLDRTDYIKKVFPMLLLKFVPGWDAESRNPGMVDCGRFTFPPKSKLSVRTDGRRRDDCSRHEDALQEDRKRLSVRSDMRTHSPTAVRDRNGNRGGRSERRERQRRAEISHLTAKRGREDH